MSLRAKAVASIFGVLIVVVASLYITSRIILMGGLSRIEDYEAQQAVRRTLGAISHTLLQLDSEAAEWAQWDDTYAFMSDFNGEYVESNLVDSTFVHLRLNAVLFIDSSGKVVFARGFDLNRQEDAPVPVQLLVDESRDRVLGTAPDVQGSISGITLLNEGAMLVSVQPILRTDSSGPARGILVFGRYLDSAELVRFAELTLSDVAMRRVDGALDADFRQALAELSAGKEVFVQPLDARNIGGYSLLRDVRGNLAVMLRVSATRNASFVAQTAVAFYILAVLLIGLVAGGVFILLLQRQVLSRLAVLIGGINRIAEKGDISTRITLSGRDELNVVAGTVNGMLAALEQSETVIRERERQYRDLFDNAEELIHSVTPEGKFIYVNPAWLKTLGYTGEEVSRLTLRDIVHPDYLAQARENHRKLMAGETVESVKSVFLTRDKRPITVEGNISCRFTDGKPEAVRAIFRDVTEAEQARLKLQQSYEQERVLRQQLEEEIRKRTEFTRALVHELKTPITPVLAAVELLRGEISDDLPLRLVQSIDRSASNLNKRIDELLDLARGETDMLQLDLREVSLLPLLQNITEEMMPLARRNGLAFSAEFPPSLPVVSADEGRLRQVTVNLLNNAMKFTPRGGHVGLKVRRDGDNIIVEVQDDGPGIAEEDQKQLFQPYYRRTGERERLSGLGLGLFLARRFVELHGGRIWVDSRLGEGSTFAFSIPVRSPETDAQALLRS